MVSRGRALVIAFLAALAVAGAATFVVIGHNAAANEAALQRFLAYTLALEEAVPQLDAITWLECSPDDVETTVEGRSYTGIVSAYFEHGHHELVVRVENDGPPLVRWRELGAMFLYRDEIVPIRDALAAQVDEAYRNSGVSP